MRRWSTRRAKPDEKSFPRADRPWHESAMNDRFDTLLIVGCGNMAGAMLRGWLAAGHDPRRFTVVDPAMPALPPGVALHRDLADAAPCDAILLGIKPQIFADIAPRVADHAGAGASVLSLLAGIDLAMLARAFPRSAAQVRVMPNLAVEIGKAPIALAQTGLGEAARGALVSFLEPLGTPEWVAEEHLDLATALVGSGPAFVYRFIDALAAAAASEGLPRDQADRFALAMVEGAAGLAAGSPHSPAELARRVTSPGGTTQAGLATLDRDGAFAALVHECLRAARARGAELAAEARR